MKKSKEFYCKLEKIRREKEKRKLSRTNKKSTGFYET